MLPLNWIDWAIVLVVGLAVIDGWEKGALELTRGLIGFLGSIWLAVRYHGPVGLFLGEKFGVLPMWQDVAAYLVVGVGGQIALGLAVGLLIGFLPEFIKKSKINRLLGIAVSVANGLLIVALFLLVILVLPVRGAIKQDINSSKLGGILIGLANKYGGKVKTDLNEAAARAVKFLTIEPASGEKLSLTGALPDNCKFAKDSQSERDMLGLVNQERSKAGAKLLVMDSQIVSVARAHSLDMLTRKYFSHITPEGKDPATRMTEGGVKFTAMGENIAYAPDLTTAHEGLMNSEGHRKNILDKEFSRVGIGIINGGVCGMMFSQDFAN